MDPITSSTQTPTSSANGKTGTANKEAEETKSNALSADFDTFLKLLTAQMQNQDPLEPTNNTEWVAQLASFSAVEQQIEANETLTAIKTALAFQSAEGLGAWISKDVLVDGGLAEFTGQPVDVEFDAADAENSTLIIRNEAKAIVGRVAIAPGSSSYSWDGTDGKGNALSHGYYGFTVENLVDGEVSGHVVGRVFATVSEVRLSEDGTELVLGNGQKVLAEDVKAIR